MKSILPRLPGLLIFSLVLAFAFTSCRNEANKIEPTCHDEIQNQGELGVDCGGPCGNECPPSCENFIIDGQETQIDCGGPDCEPCATCDDGIQNAHWVPDLNLTEADLSRPDVGVGHNGVLLRLVMETGIDCGFPCPDFCPPTCEDGIMNGDEEGIDCGGSCEYPCPPPNCGDGIQNGEETGVDCGAPGCPDCPPPSCNDGIQNIHIEYVEPTPANPEGYIVVVETGIDCDNNPNTSCPDCPLPTCFDGIQNQGETGIDCGGPCPTECDPSVACGTGFVINGQPVNCDFDPSTPCPPCPTCADGILNGPEFEIDCVDYPIPEYPCAQCISCHDNILNQKELDVDCGGPNCPSCVQYLTGTVAGSAFMDQFTLNRALALGNQDTLYVPDAFHLSATQGFIQQYRVLTAVQQIETTVGIFQRKLEIWLPPFNTLAVGAEPVPIAAYVPGVTVPPTIQYTEGFVTGNHQGMTTYQARLPELTDPNPQLIINYKEEIMPEGYGYIGGTINFARLKPFPALPGSQEITASEIEFRVHYNPYE